MENDPVETPQDEPAVAELDRLREELATTKRQLADLLPVLDEHRQLKQQAEERRLAEAQRERLERRDRWVNAIHERLAANHATASPRGVLAAVRLLADEGQLELAPDAFDDEAVADAITRIAGAVPELVVTKGLRAPPPIGAHAQSNTPTTPPWGNRRV